MTTRGNVARSRMQTSHGTYLVRWSYPFSCARTHSYNVVIGILLGLPVVAFMSHTAAKFFGLNAFDPVTLVLFPFLLLGITLCAALVPALRAIQVDPAEVLRAE
jgi:hypothetical protein